MFGGFKYLIKTRRGTLELESCDTVCSSHPPLAFSLCIVSWLLIQWWIVLTSLGEKLTNAEVDELLKGMNVHGDQINYNGIYLPRDWFRACLRLISE